MIDDDILGVEVFPTHLRSTAMAVTLVAARLGAICGNEIFGQLLGINCAIPIIMVAALMIGGINTVTLFPPELNNHSQPVYWVSDTLICHY